MTVEKSMFKLTSAAEKHFSRKTRKYMIWGILAVLVLIIVAANQLRALPVNLLMLQPTDFVRGFTEEGEVMAASEWPIFSPVEGKIQSLSVENGGTVQRGQILFELNTSDLIFELTALRAQAQSLEGQRLQSSRSPDAALVAQQNLLIQQAEQDVQTMEANFVRAEVLYEAGAISRVLFEETRDALDRAQNILEQQRYGLELLYEQSETPGTDLYFNNQVNALQARIEQIEDRIGKSTVTAPQDGRIKDLFLKEGNAVVTGQQVMTVFGQNGFKIESYVLAGDVLDIQVGSRVEMVQSSASGNRYFTGQVETVEVAAVERISPLGLRENRVKVTIRLLEDSPAVVLGSSLDVRFVTYEAAAKLLLPKTALFPYQGGDAVWLVQDGRALIQPVKKGLENDSQVIIEEGLNAGDQIIRYPNIDGLKDGKRVTEIASE